MDTPEPVKWNLIPEPKIPEGTPDGLRWIYIGACLPGQVWCEELQCFVHPPIPEGERVKVIDVDPGDE